MLSDPAANTLFISPCRARSRCPMRSYISSDLSTALERRWFSIDLLIVYGGLV